MDVGPAVTIDAGLEVMLVHVLLNSRGVGLPVVRRAMNRIGELVRTPAFRYPIIRHTVVTRISSMSKEDSATRLRCKPWTIHKPLGRANRLCARVRLGYPLLSGDDGSVEVLV